MQPHDFNLGRYVIAAAALLLLIGLVAFIGTQEPSITGAYIVQNQIFSNTANVTADNSAETISAVVEFLPAGYRPLDIVDCQDALVLLNGGTVSNVTAVLEEENGECESINITFANQIYNTNTTSAVYEIFFGKSLQRIALVGTTPANNAILSENSTTIIADLALPDVAQLEWNGVTEPMTGNGSSWWITKTSLGNGNYSFRAITDKVASENRTIEINYVPQQPQQNVTNQTNQSAWMGFVPPTPANNSVLNAQGFAAIINASSQPTIALEYNNQSANHAAALNNNSLWQKNFENITNGIYKFRAFANSTVTETRVILINYSAPQATQAQQARALELDFKAENIKPTKDVTFAVPVKNTGTTTIAEISASVDVYEAGNYLQTLDLDAVTGLDASEEGQLSATWLAPEFDLYSAEAKINWDGGSEIKIINFTIGEPLVEITRLSREQSSANSATLNADLASKWIESIGSVNVKFNIYKDGSAINTLDAGTQDIGPKESKTFSATLETEDVQALKIEAVANYGDKSAVSSLEAVKTQGAGEAAAATPAVTKAMGFAAFTGAFGRLIANPKNKTISIIVSTVIFAAIISALIIVKRKPKDPKAEYMKEYNRRVRGWQDYYAHHQQK